MAAASRDRKPSAERWALPAQQERSRATAKRIFAAAEEVFAEKGYEGARLTDIAEVAGCSVGAVYFRFKDKEALFSAIVAAFAEDARAGLAAFMEGHESADPHQTIRNFVMACAANLSRHKGLLRAIVERGLDHPSAMKAVFSLRDELAVALEKALGARGLKMRVMTQMIYGFLITGVLNRRAPTKIEDAAAIDELANACVAYYAVSP